MNIGEEVFAGCEKLQQFTLPTEFTIFKDDVNKHVELSLNGEVKQQSQQVPTSKQVSQQQTSLSSNPFVSAKVGDYIKFGSYPQTANGDIQPIEWQVLSIEGKKMLVISKYGLEARRFNDSTYCNWSTNDWNYNRNIRKWANNTFYNKAFNESEKKYINVFKSDNVFLLTKAEAERYFVNKDVRICKATEYAKVNGAYVNSDTGGSWWWLSSPHHYSYDYIYCVNFNGDTEGRDVSYNNVVFRPALWINL